VNTVLSSFEKILRLLIGEDIVLRMELAPALGNIKADPAQGEQVIMNLAVNSRDAMPTGGELAIGTEGVVVGEPFVASLVGSTAGPSVLVTVSDTGLGMPPEIMARIFEPFFTTKEHGKGTGKRFIHRLRHRQADGRRYLGGK